MKKTLLGILIFTLICASCFTVFAAEATYTDDDGHWAEEAIENLTKEAIVTGYSDNSFKPEDEITRAEYITMLVRMFKPTKLADISKYTDVASGAWYYESIAKAVGMGVVQGDNPTTMRPESNITRQEAMLILFRLLKLQAGKAGSLNVFSDGKNVSSWAVEGIASLVDMKFVNGYNDGSLKPTQNITRAEAAELLNKALETAKKLGQVPEDVKEEKPSRSSSSSSNSSSRNDKVAEIILTDADDGTYTVTRSGDKASNSNTLIVTVNGTQVAKAKLSAGGYGALVASVIEKLDADRMAKTLVGATQYHAKQYVINWGIDTVNDLGDTATTAAAGKGKSVTAVYDALIKAGITNAAIQASAVKTATKNLTSDSAIYDDVIEELGKLNVAQ